MSGLKDGRIYSKAFKEKVVLEVKSGKISKDGARSKYSIGGKSTVLKWIRKFDDIQIDNSRFIVKDKEVKIYLDRIKDLEQQLQMEKMKRLAAETIIDIAEQELKLDIRKKSNTKQSKK